MPITALPTPGPSRSMRPATFEQAMDSHIAALPQFVTEANALAVEVAAMRDDAEAKRAATETLRDETTTLKGQSEAARDLALSYRDTAGTFRTQAETARDQAQTAAAAAGSAAGLPSLVGHAGRGLIVSDDEGGVEWGGGLAKELLFSVPASRTGFVAAPGQIDVKVTAPTVGTEVYTSLIATSAMFVAAIASNPNVITSPDGEVWTLRSTGGPTASHYLAADGANVVAVVGTASFMSADHGVTWTSGGTLPAESAAIRAASGVFVVQTTTGTTRSTNNGATWSAIQASPESGLGLRLCGGLFILRKVTTPFNYYTSPDGITWTPRNSPDGGSVEEIVGGAATSKGSFSSDAITWEPMPPGISDRPLNAAKINSKFFMLYTQAGVASPLVAFDDGTYALPAANQLLNTPVMARVGDILCSLSSGYIYRIDMTNTYAYFTR